MRCYQDFRDFLTALEKEGQLLRVTEQVKFEPDLAAAACALGQIGEGVPAIMFNNIAGCTDAQVVMNAHGSWPNHAVALGMDKDASLKEQFFEFVRRFKLFPGEIERVATAPWQEVVVDKDINLFELLPLFRLNRGDGGYYIDKPCIVSRDPDDWDNDDVENVGVYRLMVKGPNRIGIQPVPQHDIAVHLAHAEARGEDLPIAISIGNEPLILLMAATPLRYDQLEYKMAAVMQGAPYKVVKTEKGLDVPWGSEYVLEGRILGRQREIEGPFGEFPGYYSGGHLYPVIEIDRVSHRKTPIFEFSLCRPAMDGARLFASHDDQRANFYPVEPDVSRGGGRQCALHPWLGGDRIDGRALWRVCEIRRHGRADHAARARLRQDRDRGR